MAENLKKQDVIAWPREYLSKKQIIERLGLPEKLTELTAEDIKLDEMTQTTNKKSQGIPVDVDSVNYFMTEMTQEEFEKRFTPFPKDLECKFDFNLIKKIPIEPKETAQEDLKLYETTQNTNNEE